MNGEHFWNNLTKMGVAFIGLVTAMVSVFGTLAGTGVIDIPLGTGSSDGNGSGTTPVPTIVTNTNTPIDGRWYYYDTTTGDELGYLDVFFIGNDGANDYYGFLDYDNDSVETGDGSIVVTDNIALIEGYDYAVELAYSGLFDIYADVMTGVMTDATGTIFVPLEFYR